MKRTATLILNRNLPVVTDKLVEHLHCFDEVHTDVFVIEAGSDLDKLSSYATWRADWPEAVSQGLRYSRGMNFGLIKLLEEGRFSDYDNFFLLTNDVEFEKQPTIAVLQEVMDAHPKVGILSPCSVRWGERLLLDAESTKYFWFIHNNCYMLRRAFVESIADFDNLETNCFLFDGTNFRGYGSEHELIAKAYANDWAAAITADAWASENESHLLEYADQIKTEGYEENLRRYLDEGRRWMKRKYGFNSHWSMQQYVKGFYDKFFEFHPEFQTFKV